MTQQAQQAGSWRIHQVEEVGSTNDEAAKLPGWHAVVAKRQVNGRGRYRRSWVSDEGGIWVSIVVPTPGAPEPWGILPLAAGWALRETVRQLGVEGTRLRWPNDLMILNAKLAGILVERFNPETAVIGIGINYNNTPAAVQPDLTGCVTRLADLLDPLPNREIVLATLLTHVAIAQQRIAQGKVSDFLPALNQAWHMERVTLYLQGTTPPITGSFLGVDETGRLLVECEDGRHMTLLPTDVELLRELR